MKFEEFLKVVGDNIPRAIEQVVFLKHGRRNEERFIIIIITTIIVITVIKPFD